MKLNSLKVTYYIINQFSTFFPLFNILSRLMADTYICTGNYFARFPQKKKKENKNKKFIKNEIRDPITRLPVSLSIKNLKLN